MKKERRPKTCEFSDATKLEALKRADWRCEECGKTKQEVGHFEIHHRVGIAIALSHHPELSHAMISSLANSVCLCASCHKKADIKDRRHHVENAKKLEEYFTQQLALALLF